MRAHHWIGIALLCGCVAGDEVGDGIDDRFATGKADGSIADGSPEACAALAAANTASEDELDDDAGLTAKAARSVVARRPFADLGALDAAPWIGPTALARLVEYGMSLGLECEAGPLADLRLHGSLFPFNSNGEGEYSPTGLAGYTVTLRRGAFMRFLAVGPGTGSNAVVDVHGPISSATAPTGAPHRMGPGAPDSAVDFLAPADGVYVVTVHGDDDDRGFFDLRYAFATEITPGIDMDALDPSIACDDDSDCPAASECGPNRGMATIASPTRVCNPSVPGSWQHGQCDEAGGTYRTVTVTADEACAMVDFLNHASYSQMFRLGPFRDWAYARSRAGGFHTLAQWARTRFEDLALTSGAVKGLKASAATWTDAGGAVEDTVKSVFERRTSLSGKVVLMPAARITRVAADGPDGEACVEIRDAASAPSSLLACSCANNPACADTAISVTPPPAAELVGKLARVHGTLRFTAGRWRIGAREIAPVDE